MKKSKTGFFCQHCGYMSPKWLGKCPSCNGWNCFAEELIVESGSDNRAEMRFNGKSLPISSMICLFQKYPEHLMPEKGFQLFQFQRWGDAKHSSLALKEALCHQVKD